MKDATYINENGESVEFEYNEDDYFYCNDCCCIIGIEDMFKQNSDKCLFCGSKDIIHFEG